MTEKVTKNINSNIKGDRNFDSNGPNNRNFDIKKGEDSPVLKNVEIEAR